MVGEKCIRTLRKCWIVVDEGKLAGIVVRKDEAATDTDARTPAQKILKVCTFKVRPERRSIKLGELLLKQVPWFVQSNQYDLVYLTTFPEQETLIDLLEYYGFRSTYTTEAGELVYEKAIRRDTLVPPPGQSLFPSRLNYPRFARAPKLRHMESRSKRPSTRYCSRTRRSQPARPVRVRWHRFRATDTRQHHPQSISLPCAGEDRAARGLITFL